MEKVDKTYFDLRMLIDSSYSNLLRLRPLVEPNSIEDFYIKIMCAFYQSDIPKLKRIKNELSNETKQDFQVLHAIIEYRQRMIIGTVTIEKASLLLSFSYSDLWKGEIEFCAALGLYKIKEFNLAKKYFLDSSKSFKQNGIIKKSLLAMQNAITMDGNIDNRNRHLFSYFEYIKECLSADATDTVANAYMNIADEFYKIGAFNTAYKYCAKSLAFLEKQPNTHQENDSLALMCEVLFGLNRSVEAMGILERLMTDQNVEIQQAVKVISYRHLGTNKETIDSDLASPPWRAKAERYLDIKKLGSTEEELIELLSCGATQLNDLVAKIYPDIDEGDSKNRATTLITRINKKYDGLILYNSKNAIYQLSFNELIHIKEVEYASL